MPELRKNCPCTPYILVGTKSDLKEDKVSLLRLDRLQNLRPISTNEGEKLARKIQASKFIECSAVSGV